MEGRAARQRCSGRWWRPRGCCRAAWKPARAAWPWQWGWWGWWVMACSACCMGRARLGRWQLARLAGSHRRTHSQARGAGCSRARSACSTRRSSWWRRWRSAAHTPARACAARPWPPPTPPSCRPTRRGLQAPALLLPLPPQLQTQPVPHHQRSSPVPAAAPPTCTLFSLSWRHWPLAGPRTWTGAWPRLRSSWRWRWWRCRSALSLLQGARFVCVCGGGGVGLACGCCARACERARVHTCVRCSTVSPLRLHHHLFPHCSHYPPHGLITRSLTRSGPPMPWTQPPPVPPTPPACWAPRRGTTACPCAPTTTPSSPRSCRACLTSCSWSSRPRVGQGPRPPACCCAGAWWS